MNVDFFASVLRNEFHGIADMSDAALTQDVELFVPQILGHIHIPLHRRKTFGWQIERGIHRHRVLGHQNAARMNTAQIRKVAYGFAHSHDFLNDAVIGFERFALFDQRINLGFRKTVHLAEFAIDRFVAESLHHPKQGRVFRSVAFENIILHISPVFPRKINIEIRRAGSLRIDEAFEIKIKLNRIDIGNIQAIRHNAVGAAAPPHVIKSARHGIAHNVPGHEKIRRKAEPVDNLQFFANALQYHLRFVRVARRKTIESKLFEQQLVIVAAAGKDFFVAHHAQLSIGRTIAEQIFGIDNQVAAFGKGFVRSFPVRHDFILHGQLR
ncbi:hypothetical protein SDC9_76052 [bioreactor metagenome]|uniref:Uncharacterized protein n=1 Tax=bioreactor metagenome TaxID=1076179 RepID=A0A644YLK5_9ZZZZ